MAVKHIYFFNRGRNGWTETWYRQPEAVDFVAEMNVAAAWATFRTPMLASGCQLDAIRVSDTNVLGSGFLSREKGQAANQFINVGAVDQKKLSALFRAEADQSVYKRPVLLRGIPDDFAAFDLASGAPQPSEEFIKLYQVWEKATFDAGYRLRVLSKNVPAGTAPEKDIIDVFGTGGQLATINVPNHGYAQGQEIRIRRAKFVGPGPIINGVWRVRLDLLAGALQADNFQIDQTVYNVDEWRYWANGVVQARNILYRPADFLAFERFTQRDTGSAFFRGRGRAPKLKLP